MATEVEHTLIRLSGEFAMLQAKLLRTARALIVIEQHRAELLEKTAKGSLGDADVMADASQARDNAATASRIADLAQHLRPAPGPPEADVIQLTERRHADDRLSAHRHADPSDD